MFLSAGRTLRIGARMCNVRVYAHAGRGLFPPSLFLFHLAALPHNFLRPSSRGKRPSEGAFSIIVSSRIILAFPAPLSVCTLSPSLWAALVIKSVPTAAPPFPLPSPSFDTTATRSSSSHPSPLPPATLPCLAPAFLPHLILSRCFYSAGWCHTTDHARVRSLLSPFPKPGQNCCPLFLHKLE